MSFDIEHFNLHKSFTQPPGGGGPGVRPDRRVDRIAEYLPVPLVVRGPDRPTPTNTTGPSRSAASRVPRGNWHVRTRLRLHPARRGGGHTSRTPPGAVTASYLLARLPRPRPRRRPPSQRCGGSCASPVRAPGLDPMNRRLGIHHSPRQRLLDFGFRPPTCSAALDEALMVEPTGVETRETLDALAEAVAAIVHRPRGPADRGGRPPRARPCGASPGLLRPSARHRSNPRGAGRGRQGGWAGEARIFSGISPPGAAPGNPIGAIAQYVSAGARRGDLLHRRPARDHGRLRPRRAARAHLRHRRDPARGRARPRPLHPFSPERRARAHRADLAAVRARRARPPAAHAPVPRQGAGAAGLGGNAAVPGARRPRMCSLRLPRRGGAGQDQRASGLAETSRGSSTLLGDGREVLKVPEHRIPEVGARSWTCRSRLGRCRPRREQGIVFD